VAKKRELTERRRNTLSETDLENISLRMENASLKAFEKHKADDHAPLIASIARLNKFKTQTMAVGGFLTTVAGFAWTDIKGFFHHGGGQ
jgi:hypothetical protein